MEKQEEKIFISYAHQDVKFALKLANDLRSRGVNIWMAKLNLITGVNFQRIIENALKTCSGFLIILSPNAIVSENVINELRYAIQKKNKSFQCSTKNVISR